MKLPRVTQACLNHECDHAWTVTLDGAIHECPKCGAPCRPGSSPPEGMSPPQPPAPDVGAVERIAGSVDDLLTLYGIPKDGAFVRDLRYLLTAERERALEGAANVCDDFEDESRSDFNVGYANGAAICGTRVRALKHGGPAK